MKVIHTSPAKIEKIYNSELFGDCLFFSHDEYWMYPGEGGVVYSLDMSNDKVISVGQLYDDEFISKIAGYFDIDADSAERILDGRDTALDHGGDGEDDWWIQGLQGACGKKMGYDAVEAWDEQGLVYIVPMTGRLGELVIEEEL